MRAEKFRLQFSTTRTGSEFHVGTIRCVEELNVFTCHFFSFLFNDFPRRSTPVAAESLVYRIRKVKPLETYSPSPYVTRQNNKGSRSVLLCLLRILTSRVYETRVFESSLQHDYSRVYIIF